jgi:hypothetical protein
MRRSSARERGQTEPFAALVAVVVVALALSVWAGVFEASLPEPVDRDVAEPTADRVERALTVAGVVRPDRTGSLNSTGPEGYELNVTLTADDDRWSVGPATPPTADMATRRVSVSDDSGSVTPGRLEVRVWT